MFSAIGTIFASIESLARVFNKWISLAETDVDHRIAQQHRANEQDLIE